METRMRYSETPNISLTIKNDDVLTAFTSMFELTQNNPARCIHVR